MTTQDASVVVSGLGVISSCGAGTAALADALRTGTRRFTPVDRRYHRRFGAAAGARLAATVDAASVGAWLPPARARRMSRPSRFAVAAAIEATAAREAASQCDWSRAAVCLGTCYGPSAYTEGLLRQVHDDGPQAASPVLFIESVANAPAAQVALRLGCRGTNVTVTQREASALLAVAEAVDVVAAGEAPRALAGSVEELDPLLHSVLDRYGALARPLEGGDERALPFARERTGFVLGEGAAVVVVEPTEAAPRRLAGIRGCIAAFDPRAPQTSWSDDPAPLVEALRRGLERSACPAESIDLIVSGASGSRPGDALEAAVLRAVWPRRTPPVLTPKAITGEFGGATLAAAVRPARERIWAPD